MECLILKYFKCIVFVLTLHKRLEMNKEKPHQKIIIGRRYPISR